MTWGSNLTVPLLSAVACGGIIYAITRLSIAGKPQGLVQALPSPRVTLLPHLSEEQCSALPYPPNLFPGARDVDTPYGSMRVYEWGSEHGEKVVMVPGDASPAPVFGHIAQALVKRGYRVMIIDTWGRGYSDSPKNVPYDVNLFSSQIFFAIASSPLSWTGLTSGGFSVMGFSLGGAVTMSLASYFPYLINSIILLAPGGMIQTLPDGYESTLFRYRSLVPYRLLRSLLAKVLGTSLTPAPLPTKSAEPVSVDSLDLPALWQWQFDHHTGFQHSFIDTTQNGPLANQHEDWRRACSYIANTRSQPANIPIPCRLSKNKLLIVCGDDDSVVVSAEVREEVSKMLPTDRLVFKTVPGTHSFPAFSGPAVLKHIYDFWDVEA